MNKQKSDIKEDPLFKILNNMANCAFKAGKKRINLIIRNNLKVLNTLTPTESDEISIESVVCVFTIISYILMLTIIQSNMLFASLM